MERSRKQTEQREPKGDGNEWQVETLSSLGTVAYRELCERSVVFTASGIKEGAVPFHPLSVLTANR